MLLARAGELLFTSKLYLGAPTLEKVVLNYGTLVHCKLIGFLASLKKVYLLFFLEPNSDLPHYTSEVSTLVEIYLTISWCGVVVPDSPK